MEIILILLYFIVPAFILYFIIKFAVKNAIKESLEEVEKSIKKSVKSVLNERDFWLQSKSKIYVWKVWF